MIDDYRPPVEVSYLNRYEKDLTVLKERLSAISIKTDSSTAINSGLVLILNDTLKLLDKITEQSEKMESRLSRIEHFREE